MKQRVSTKEEYQKQVNIIIEYINAHLDEDLDLASLAEKANFSPFHFHRIMKAFLGESLGAFIVRLRLETAARLLLYSDLSVQAIAYQTGYDVPSSLSKSFKLFYGISPTKFRNKKKHMIMRVSKLNENFELASPRIEQLLVQKAIYVQLIGEYSGLDFCGAWKRLWEFIEVNQLFSTEIKHVCIYQDDPNLTVPEKLRTDVCLLIDKPVEAKGEVGVKDIEGGRYAIFHYQGTYDNLGLVYDTIFGKWLPESSYTLRNVPLFEKYLNNPDNTTPEKLETEIYLPIE